VDRLDVVVAVNVCVFDGRHRAEDGLAWWAPRPR
jgi:hypothetical protein